MPNLFQGSINEVRDRVMKATEKKMVALELYSEIVGEYDKLEGLEEEASINDDNETIEIMIGEKTTVCATDGSIVIDREYEEEHEHTNAKSTRNIEFVVPINDRVVENVINVLKAIQFVKET